MSYTLIFHKQDIAFDFIINIIIVKSTLCNFKKNLNHKKAFSIEKAFYYTQRYLKPINHGVCPFVVI